MTQRHRLSDHLARTHRIGKRCLFLLFILCPVPLGAVEPVTSMPSTATVSTSANVALSSVLISPANSSRRGFILYNNSANSVYITLAPTSGSSTCSLIIASFSNYTFSSFVSYIGPISAIRNAGTGSVIVTEFQ